MVRAVHGSPVSRGLCLSAGIGLSAHFYCYDVTLSFNFYFFFTLKQKYEPSINYFTFYLVG